MRSWSMAIESATQQLLKRFARIDDGERWRIKTGLTEFCVVDWWMTRECLPRDT